MCLAIPAEVVSIQAGDLAMNMGVIAFGGIAKEVSLAFVPDAKVGDYVIVHAGFAISKIDEQEARETLALLKQLSELGEVEATG